jgi:hypothetical protein
MGRRSDLNTVLQSIPGVSKAYFQPPVSVKMTYPCIVYARSTGVSKYAGNLPYANFKGYSVTVITQDPDSPIPDKVAELPTSRFERYYAVNNLHHFVYRLFY